MYNENTEMELYLRRRFIEEYSDNNTDTETETELELELEFDTDSKFEKEINNFVQELFKTKGIKTKQYFYDLNI